MDEQITIITSRTIPNWGETERCDWCGDQGTLHKYYDKNGVPMLGLFCEENCMKSFYEKYPESTQMG